MQYELLDDTKADIRLFHEQLFPHEFTHHELASGGFRTDQHIFGAQSTLPFAVAGYDGETDCMITSLSQTRENAEASMYSSADERRDEISVQSAVDRHREWQKLFSRRPKHVDLCRRVIDFCRICQQCGKTSPIVFGSLDRVCNRCVDAMHKAKPIPKRPPPPPNNNLDRFNHAWGVLDVRLRSIWCRFLGSRGCVTSCRIINGVQGEHDKICDLCGAGADARG